MPGTQLKSNAPAGKVVHNSESPHSTGPDANELPRQFPIKVLLIRTVSQPSTSQCEQDRIPQHNRVILVTAKPGLLGLGFRLGPLARLRFGVIVLLFLLTPEAFGLGGGFDVLPQEIRVDGANMWGIDVNQGCGAFFGAVPVNG